MDDPVNDSENGPTHAKEALIAAIKNQIANNDPPETKEHYQRLINEGWSKDDALILLGRALTYEMFHVMRDKREFDHSNYVKLLEQLPDLD